MSSGQSNFISDNSQLKIKSEYVRNRVDRLVSMALRDFEISLEKNLPIIYFTLP